MGIRFSREGSAEQLTSEQILALDAHGAPPPSTDGIAFEPFPGLSAAVGQSAVDVRAREERIPALFVRIEFPTPVGRSSKYVPWTKGKRLQYYLKDLSLIGLRMSCRLLNGDKRKVRMSYVPKQNETIRLVRTGSPSQ